MAGIYIHIPFCKKACHYCNFHFSTSLQNQPSVVAAICEEAVLQKSYLNEPVTTLYLGGGTPSLLTSGQIEAILSTIKANYSLAPDAEITIEANPDDINEEGLRSWQQAGINRLSLGVQSFFEEDLVWMNRAHNALQAKESIVLARQMGFQNITIDLIYGSPGLTQEKWKHNLETAFSLGIPHLSCYALTVEPKTALSDMIQKGRKKDVDPEIQAEQFLQLTNTLCEWGYEHYEISNFAQPGYRSKHNSSYWQSKPYLGLGPSAHSFDGKSRQWNVANNSLYLSGILSKNPVFETELLTPTQQFNEYVMTSLRTLEGISLDKITHSWGAASAQQLILACQKHEERGHLQLTNQGIYLTKKGRFLADGISADLFKE